MLVWQCAFRVSETQDKDVRYSEVLSGVVIPDECVNDVQDAHDEVWAILVPNEPTKPYAVYLSGTRDGQDVTMSNWIEENA